MQVNGRQVTLERENTVGEFLRREGYDVQRVAVEKNGGIVPKRLFDTETLSDGDSLEIVSFVGGG